jgi:hypothetical protein
MALARRDINTLSESELSDYIHAIDILQKRSAADPDEPTGFAFQAALHNDPLVGPCEHGSDLFFPWHRAHLHYFEKLLQEAEPPRTSNVTIPYWDWIHPQPVGNFPAAFDQPILFAPGRFVGGSEPLPGDTLTIVTTETDWGSFGGFPEDTPDPEQDGNYGALERGPHNYMHGIFIGGKMGDGDTAAEDPIYFSFHCFIDLLWAEWQRRNGMPPPTSPDADLRGFQSQPMHKVADFHDTQDLNYVYEYTDQLEAAFGIEAPRPAPRARREIQPLELAFDTPATEQLLDTEHVQFRLAAPREPGAAVLVRLEQKLPDKGTFMLRGYVHPEDVPFDDEDEGFREKYFVGYVVLWHTHGPHVEHGEHPAHASQPHHPTSCIFRFDVTRVLDSEAPPEEHLLTVRYVPAPGASPEQIQEVALENVRMEVYA